MGSQSSEVQLNIGKIKSKLEKQIRSNSKNKSRSLSPDIDDKDKPPLLKTQNFDDGNSIKKIARSGASSKNDSMS